MRPRRQTRTTVRSQTLTDGSQPYRARQTTEQRQVKLQQDREKATVHVKRDHRSKRSKTAVK